MKEDIANREYQLRIKALKIGAVVMIAGALIAGIGVFGLMGLMASLNGVPAAGVVSGIAGGLAAGEGIGLFFCGAAMGAMFGLMAGIPIAELMTYKERTKLQIDKDMTQSYMQGKNYWGEGYREEVAERGYGGPRLPASPAKRPTGRVNG